jgi:prepilin-type N-terminal cleavage/methylation domain-containing protein
MPRPSSESGFSLIELLVATCIFLVITGIVASALKQITQSQSTVWNRTQMHSGVRGATELMQQEVGQAGRVATPVPIKIDPTNPMITGQVTLGAFCDPRNPGISATTVKVNSVAGLYATGGTVPASYVLITTMDGPNRETTPIWSIDTSVTPPTLTACFNNDHAPGATLMPLGGFANGIVPPADPPTNFPNGSTGSVLKMFGDLNGDGNMVYVEYTCDFNTNKLYRNVMNFTATAKPALANSLVLLNNVMQNPGGTPCFTYQTDGASPQVVVQGQPVVFVLDVAITLTVQTQQKDPVTGGYQKETKALLNVSPRNVFNSWQLANAGFTDHIQSTPATVSALLGMPPS